MGHRSTALKGIIGEGGGLALIVSDRGKTIQELHSTRFDIHWPKLFYVVQVFTLIFSAYLCKKSFLPRNMGMHANATKKTASNIIESVGIIRSITFPITSPRTNEYVIKRIVPKSKLISLVQFLQSLRSQNGDGKTKISQIFTACSLQ